MDGKGRSREMNIKNGPVLCSVLIQENRSESVDTSENTVVVFAMFN